MYLHFKNIYKMILETKYLQDYTTHIRQTGQHSPYSTSLGAGRSGVWTPVGVIFYRPIQTSPKDHPALRTMDTRSLSQVQTWGMALTTHPLLAVSLSICRVTPLHTLCAGLACNGRALSHMLADISLSVCLFS